MPEYGVNPNVYNGGATVFNNRPFANFWLQRQAHEQAKNEAMDKYYRDQLQAVTPTGMRAKDIEGGFSKKLNDWQNFGIQNKKYLLNPSLDNYQSLNEFNRGKNELHQDIALSKEAGENEKVIATHKLSGTWNPSDTDAGVAADIGKPIYDKTRVGNTLNDFSFNHPAFDNDKFDKAVTAGYKRGVVEDAPIINKTLGNQVTNSRQVYGDPEIKSAASRAMNMVSSDRSYNDHFEKALHGDQMPALQQSYEKYFLGDHVNTPAKAAAAYTIMNMATPTGQSTKTEKYVDPNAELNRQMTMEGVRFGHEKELVNLRASKEAKKSVDDAGGIYDYINNLKDQAKQNPRVVTSLDGKQTQQYDIPVDNASKEIFAIGSGKDAKYPDRLRFTEDGKSIVPIFFKYDDKGNVLKDKQSGAIMINDTDSKPVSVDAVAAAWGKSYLGVKANQKTMQGNSPADYSHLSKEASDWKQVGNLYQYKDGTMYDASGKVVKKK